MPDSYQLFQIGIQLSAEVCAWAVPVAFAIGVSNMIINTFFSVAFGGRLKIGGK